MSSVASSLGENVRRSFRSHSDRSSNDNDRKEDKDTAADKSPQKQTKRGFLTTAMSNIAPKNPPLHYCILFTISMLLTASVTMGGALVYRSLLRGNETQETEWEDGLSSHPSSFYPSYAPSERESLTFEPSPMAPGTAIPSTNTIFSSIPTETEGCADDHYFLFTIDNGNTQDW